MAGYPPGWPTHGDALEAVIAAFYLSPFLVLAGRALWRSMTARETRGVPASTTDEKDPRAHPRRVSPGA